jgi:hypothetical protein
MDVMYVSVITWRTLLFWWFAACYESVPVTTKFVSSILVHREVYSIQQCDEVCPWLTGGRRFSPGTPVSSTNILLKVVICFLLVRFICSVFNGAFSIGIDGTHCICNTNDIVESICDDSRHTILLLKTVRSILSPPILSTIYISLQINAKLDNYKYRGGCRGRDRMVLWFAACYESVPVTTYVSVITWRTLLFWWYVVVYLYNWKKIYQRGEV